jgi:hypothetical protein
MIIDWHAERGQRVATAKERDIEDTIIHIKKKQDVVSKETTGKILNQGDRQGAIPTFPMHE